jgi:hypothetical protein
MYPDSDHQKYVGDKDQVLGHEVDNVEIGKCENVKLIDD